MASSPMYLNWYTTPNDDTCFGPCKLSFDYRVNSEPLQYEFRQVQATRINVFEFKVGNERINLAACPRDRWMNGKPRK